MTKTLGIGQIPPPLLDLPMLRERGYRTLGAGHAASGYLLTAVDTNVFSTRSEEPFDPSLERRRCNCGRTQPARRFQ
ncbi:MAG: hypothetical protein QOD67_4028 [Caballeronia sp.]|nr:hypothetical protein [Caballeronia sp.]